MLKRYLHVAILLFSLLVVQNAFATETSLQAIFMFEKNNPDKTFSANITLKNTSNTPISHWQLALTSIRPILSASEATITQIGGFHLISPNDKAQTIPAHGTFVLHVTGKWFVKRNTDTPSGYFLVITDQTTLAESTLPLASEVILPAWNENDEYTRTNQKNSTPIENNPVKPSITLQQSLIIPLPAELKRYAGEFILKSNTVIIIDKNIQRTPPAAQFFVNAIAPATGYHLNINVEKIDHTPANAIIFTQQNTDKKLGAEGYTLQVSPNKIIINAATDTGFFYAAESLRQLLPAAIFDKTIAHRTTWNIPALSIHDYPRFAYRGLSLDVARHFIPVDQVKRLLDLMALHKLNQFQWHLSDDEGFRVEIKKYPTLTSIGAWRGFRQALPPALGSGPESYGGYYSQAEIRDIVNYANERHITIIPEIDMPGHARALIMSLPNELMDPEDKSQYASVQNYHDNVLSPCLDSTFVVIDNIFTEIADLFPGDIIHVGSDEVPQSVWTQSPRCQKLMTSLGLKNADALQNYFLNRIQKIIQSKNKKMAGWEEIIKGGDLPKSTSVYSWTNEDAGITAAKNGYPVVMMPAQYLYFDLAYTADPIEPGFSWAGYVDTFQTYSYQPIQVAWTSAVAKQIIGIQGALWSENINSSERLDYLAFPKLLALSEVAWTPKARRNWINFSERVGKLHLKRLDHYGVQYRISLPGINLPLLAKGILDANVEFPGLALRYNLSKTTPSSSALLYSKPVKSKGIVSIRTFNSMNRGSRSIMVSDHLDNAAT